MFTLTRQAGNISDSGPPRYLSCRYLSLAACPLITSFSKHTGFILSTLIRHHSILYSYFLHLSHRQVSVWNFPQHLSSLHQLRVGGFLSLGTTSVPHCTVPQVDKQVTSTWLLVRTASCPSAQVGAGTYIPTRRYALTLDL